MTIASSTSAQPADTATRDKALELFRASDAHYKVGEFEEAARLLRESYDLYPEPLILYNLGRALEGMGDFAGAVEQYERYLATATEVNDRGAIERRLATLRAQLAAGAAAKTAPPTPPPIDPVPPTVSDDPPPGRFQRLLPWIVAGSGAVIVGVGGVLGVMSDSRHKAAVDEPIQAEADRLQAKAKSLATTANVMFVVAGAAVIGGVVWGVIRMRRGAHREVAKPGASRLIVAPAYVGIEWTLP